MARKTILVCDNCGTEVEEGRGAVMRVTFTDARRGAKAADLCDGCAGHDARQRGRAARPQAQVCRRRHAARTAGPLRPSPAAGVFPHFAATLAARKEVAAKAATTMDMMGLSLVVGPAHAGKVALLLDRFVAALDRDPWLDRPEPRRRRPGRARARRPGRRAARRHRRHVRHAVRLPRRQRPSGRAHARRRRAEHRAPAPSSRRHRRARSGRPPASPVSPTRSRGALTEIEASLLEPDDLDPGLAELTRAYRGELERLGVRDRGMVRRRAVERLTSELGSWNGAPVFAYGFEDLTGAEWRLIEALAARGEVHVSLPYEPGRAAFASLSRTVADLGALAGGDIVELARRLRRATCRRRSRTSSATSSTTAPRRRRSTARFASSKAQAGARRSSSWPRRPRPRPRRHRARRRSRSSARRSSAPARRSRRPSASLGVPVVDRGAAAARRRRRSGRRCSRCSASPGATARAASSSRSCARRTAGSRRSDVDFLEGRLRGRAVVRGDRTDRGDDEAANRPPASDARAARRRGRAACRPRGRWCSRCSQRLRPRRAARAAAAAKRDLRAAEAAGRDPRRARAAARGRDRDPHRGRARGPRPGDRPRRRSGRARSRRRPRPRRAPARGASRRSS